VTNLLMRLRSIFGDLLKKRNRRPISTLTRMPKGLAEAWQDPGIPHKQWELVERQLLKMEADELSAEFEVFVRSIESALCLEADVATLLEIGCSSGYYGEVLRRYFPSIKYIGIDYSQSFVDFGKSKFPNFDLRKGDTTALEMSDGAFDVVVSGSVLLHVMEWQKGLRESCRVARRVLILHRTPVSSAPTTLFTKSAYGQKMIEWTFNEDELVDTARSEGFRLVSSCPVYEGGTLGVDPSLPNQFTYVFDRI